MPDGPLTNMANALCSVGDGNGLNCVKGTTSGVATPPTNAFNLRVCINNGQLVVVPSGFQN